MDIPSTSHIVSLISSTGLDPLSALLLPPDHSFPLFSPPCYQVCVCLHQEEMIKAKNHELYCAEHLPSFFRCSDAESVTLLK